MGNSQGGGNGPDRVMLQIGPFRRIVRFSNKEGGKGSRSTNPKGEFQPHGFGENGRRVPRGFHAEKRKSDSASTTKHQYRKPKAAGRFASLLVGENSSCSPREG